jgi:hypothetical protein
MRHVKKASSRIAVAACLLLAAGGSVRQANSQAASPTLDYQFFKDKVQAVFLHKREGHTRCVACHTVNNVMTMHLVPLSQGATTWNEEQSRQNFQWVQRVVVPGYEDSLLISIRSPKRLAAIPVTAAASNSPRRTTRTGRL